MAAPDEDPTTVAILEGLYQHRLLLSRQVQVLYTPGTSRQWTHRLLRRLERAGLAGSVRQPGGAKVLFLTPTGLEVCEAAPTAETRCKLISPEHAAGLLQRHTLAVNDVGIAFVLAARERGDEFGPLAWRHEIAHPIGPAPGRRTMEQLIADALMTYERRKPDGAVRFDLRFLELDRNTMPVGALAEKVGRYARLYHHTVADTDGAPVAFWRTRYPVFPTVLIVLDRGAPAVLHRRRDALLALCAADPLLRRTPEIQVAVCLMDDLRRDGPFAGIWRSPADPHRPVDWLGQPTEQRRDRPEF